MQTHKWVASHFDALGKLPLLAEVTDSKGNKIELHDAFDLVLKAANKHKAHLFFVGNGGSAAIASHMATDYQKNGGYPSLAFNDSSSLTCLANDMGYDQVFAFPVGRHAKKNDVVFAISSSGKSASIIEAAKVAQKAGCRVITLSGFRRDNPLRKLGCVNFYIPAMDYGSVEITHMSLLHAILDFSMGIGA